MSTDPMDVSPGKGSDAEDVVRAKLESERDDLLRSIRDLDREHRFGDMSDADYERLRDRYTVEAADVLRRLSPDLLPSSSGTVPRSASAGATPPGTAGGGSGRRIRRVAVVALVATFAVVSGVMVARAAGQRGDNAITGSQGSIREQLATCQPLAFSDPAKGVECYASILDKAPDNVEALTYQGWAMVRAGDVDSAGTNFAKVVQLDPRYPDVRVFRAVVAVRAKDFGAASEELDEFYRNDPSDMAIQVLQSQGLEREIFFGLQPPAVTECWQRAAEAGGGSEQLDADFYATLGGCLDDVSTTTPDDVDALVSRAFAAAGSASLTGGSTIEAATPYLDRALDVEPTHANALLMRAGLEAVNGMGEEAVRDLDALGPAAHPTISFLIGSPQQIRTGL